MNFCRLFLRGAVLTLALATIACDAPPPTGPGPAPGSSTLLFSWFDPVALRWSIRTSSLEGGPIKEVPLPTDNGGDEPPDIMFFQPQWSPDGRHIVYRTSNTNTDNWYLALSDTGGSFRRLLTGLTGFMDGARWNPLSDRLLYHAGGFVGGSAGNLVQTVLVDTLGNSTDFFIEGDGEEFEGERVYFGLLPWIDSTFGVPSLYEAEWAADGRHLIVIGTIGRRWWDPDFETRHVELFRVSVETRRVVERVTHNDVPEWGFRLSPDERHLLLTVRHQVSTWYPVEGEYFMPIDGQAADMVPVVQEQFWGDGKWATDSRHITYIRPMGPEGEPRVYVYDTQTRTSRDTQTDGYWPHLWVPPE